MAGDALPRLRHRARVVIGMLPALLVLLLVLVAPATALAGPGDPDVAIASSGRTALTVGAGSAQIAGVAARPDGRALLGGVAAPADGGLATGFVQLGATGAVDPTFGTHGTALLDPVLAGGVRPAGIALQPDGGVIAVTNVRDPQTLRDTIHVMRLLPTGQLDPAFGTDGVLALSDPSANVWADDVMIDTHGRIVVAASTDTGDKQLLSAYRLLGNGQLDPDFATDGRIDIARRARAGAVVPRPGGGAILVGSSTSPRGGLRLSAFSSSGHRLDRFGHGLIRTAIPRSQGRTHTTVADAVRGPNGTIIVAASAGAGSKRWITLARYTSSGRLDKRFGERGLAYPGGKHRRFAVGDMVRDRAGRLLLAGSVHTATRHIDAAVLRTDARGRLNRRFGRRGVAITRLGGVAGVTFSASEATGIAIAQPGRVLVGGIAYADGTSATGEPVRRGWAAAMWLRN